MRIGIEVQRIFRQKKHGMELVAVELIRQIQQLDPDNEYVLFAKEGEDNGTIRETANFRIEKIPSLTYADWEQIRLPAAVKRSGVDFLHCTCNTAPLSCPVPLMLTLHDIIYLEKVDFKGTAYQNFGNLYRRFIVPRIIRNSKLIVTVSHFEKTTILEKLRLPEEKVKVVYNAVNARFNNNYRPEQVLSFRKKYNLPENFMLFLGNTAPKKNTPNVLRAFADYHRRTKDFIPLVILDYDKSLVEQALTASGDAKCFAGILFPGYIAPSDMPLMYNSATLFLYPSLRESFGLPILEAMASGTPVITSSTSSMPEVAGDASLLVDPYAPPQLSEAILRLLSDSSLREIYRQKGLERAAKFTWEASARQLLTLYKEIY